jgi:hypothetical protein
MPQAVLHKYLDFGTRALSNVSLRSGERMLISVVPRGLSVRRLHLRGFIPGASLFAANAIDTARMLRVLARSGSDLPPLPQAIVHRDDAAMLEFLEAATVDLKAVTEGKPAPGAVQALDLQNRPERPLSLMTRVALAASNAQDLARRYERARNSPG